MAKPVTLLEQLCGHAMSFGAQSFDTERKDGRQRAFAQIDGARRRIANFEDSSADAKELRANLYAAAQKARSHGDRRKGLHSPCPRLREVWRGRLRGKH